MSNEFLFNVPTQPKRIEAFKGKHQIQTHRSQFSDGLPWTALHMPTVWAQFAGYGVTPNDDFFECVSKVCRLLDESHIMGYGRTEADAILETCKTCGVTVLPADL